MKCLQWIDRWGEEFAVSIMLSLLILLLGTEVFSRFLLGKSFSWIEELCRYLFVWASYLGVAIAVKHKEQLRILMLMVFRGWSRPATSFPSFPSRAFASSFSTTASGCSKT